MPRCSPACPCQPPRHAPHTAPPSSLPPNHPSPTSPPPPLQLAAFLPARGRFVADEVELEERPKGPLQDPRISLLDPKRVRGSPTDSGVLSPQPHCLGGLWRGGEEGSTPRLPPCTDRPAPAAARARSPRVPSQPPPHPPPQLPPTHLLRFDSSLACQALASPRRTSCLWAAWRSWASPLVRACKRYKSCRSKAGGAVARRMPVAGWPSSATRASPSLLTRRPATPCPPAALIGEALTGKGILGQIGIETGLPISEVRGCTQWAGTLEPLPVWLAGPACASPCSAGFARPSLRVLEHLHVPARLTRPTCLPLALQTEPLLLAFIAFTLFAVSCTSQA